MREKNNIYSIEFKINVIERYNSGDEGGVKALSKNGTYRIDRNNKKPIIVCSILLVLLSDILYTDYIYFNKRLSSFSIVSFFIRQYIFPHLSHISIRKL